MTRFAVILLLVGFSYANNVYDNTAYGYLQRYGVPTAEKVRQAEVNLKTTRIVGGTPVSSGLYSYQAGVLISIIDVNGTGICGASLVSANKLVTAAHCWYDGINQALLYLVVLGSVTLFSGGTRIETSNVIMHPNWLPRYIRNDVAIITLPEPVTYSSTIAPVALPSGLELRDDFKGSTVITSGFGLTSDDSSVHFNQSLNYVMLTVISNSLCSVYYPRLVRSSHICTGGFGGVGTCLGDSGGPLVVTRNDTTILIGVVSFGSAEGCKANSPAVYSRVNSFINFIRRYL